MNDIIILDNVIPVEKQQDLIELCENPYFTWSYNSGNVQPEYSNDEFPVTSLSLNHQQMYNVIYKDQETVSPFIHFFIPLLSAVPFTCGHLLKIKVNLTTCNPKYSNDCYGMPHADFPMIRNNITCIYYVNDSDGDTVIFNERYGHTGDLTIKNKITPKQGRLVAFDGSLLHSGNFPRDNENRIIVNINFLPYGGMKSWDH